MLTLQTSSEKVMTLRLSGILTAEDILAAKEKLLARLDAQDKLGLVIDLAGMEDVTAGALREDMKLEWAMLKRLGQVPKIALIADKQWVTAAAKMVGPMMPSTDMKVFSPARAGVADQAAAFAADFTTAADQTLRQPSIVRLSTDRDDLLAFEYRGHVETDDLPIVTEPLKEAIARHGKVDLLVRLKNFSGFDPRILFQGSLLSLKVAAIKHLRRYAIIGPGTWMKQSINLVDPLLSIDMRTFDHDDEAAAWQWLRESSSPPHAGPDH